MAGIVPVSGILSCRLSVSGTGRSFSGVPSKDLGDGRICVGSVIRVVFIRLGVLSFIDLADGGEAGVVNVSRGSQVGRGSVLGVSFKESDLVDKINQS